MSKSKAEAIAVRQVTEWKDLVDAEEGFATPDKEWIFRGQDSFCYSLSTTLERSQENLNLPTEEVPRLEKQILIDFVRSYHLYTHNPLPSKGKTIEQLALMRHHGAPSRLLDFSFSVFIAAYFALEGAKPDKNSVIWAVDKNWLTVQGDDFGDDKKGLNLPREYL